MSEGMKPAKIFGKKRVRRNVVSGGEMLSTTQDPLQDRNVMVSYPVQSDSRGAARVSHERKPFHFGTFDSPHSYVLFGLWKAQLIQNGEPVPCAFLRPVADTALQAQPHYPPRLINSRWFVVATLVGLFTIAAANYFGYRFYSSYRHATVDGMELSERELRMVRHVRTITSAVEGSDAPPEVRTSEALEALQSEKGTSHANQAPPD